jgi:hypothetical protein
MIALSASKQYSCTSVASHLAGDSVVRITFVIALLCLLAARAAFGQIPKGNVFVGYSYARSDVLPASNPTIMPSVVRANLNGWDGSLEGKVFPFVGIVVDISSQYGGQDFRFACEAIPSPPCAGEAHVNSTLHNYLFGPRISVSVGKFTPFAHALFGASHISTTGSGFSNSDTSFSEARRHRLQADSCRGMAISG